MDEELKRNLLNKRKEILSLVKEEIDKVLNPNKPQHDLTKTEGELLNSLGPLPKQKYGFDMANDGPYMGKIWDG